MNKPVGLSMYEVGREHVDPVVRLSGEEAVETLRPTRLTGSSLIGAANDSKFVSSAQCKVDLTHEAPAVALVLIRSLAKVGHGVEAANNAHIRVHANGLNS